MPVKSIYALTRALIFIVLILLGWGCSPPTLQKRQRYFWPPPPDEAKIEYLNYYLDVEDLQRGVDRRFRDAILGKSRPERLAKQPYSVASDGKGRIFIGDLGDGHVTVLDRPNHTIRYLLTMKGAPQKVLVDKRGEIWVLDAMNAMVYRFTADEKAVAELSLPGVSRAVSLTVDSERQRLYVSDVPNHRICVYDYAGTLLQSLGSRGTGPGEFNYPTDLDLDPAGNLYVVDSMNARIQVFTPEGLFIRSFGERGTARGAFSVPKGIAVSPSGLVYVSDANRDKVVIFNTAGDYLLTIGGRDVYDGNNIRPGGLYFPAGVDVDSNETIFVADFFNGMIHEFQYLTPAFLARRPIQRDEIYDFQADDLKGVDPKKDAVQSPPLTAPGAVAPVAPAIKPQ